MGRISLKLTRAFCAISAVLLYSNVALANCPLPDPEKEDIIQYRNGYTAALGPSEAKLPFCLKVSIDGDVTATVKGKADITTSKDTNVTSSANVNIKGKKINLN